MIWALILVPATGGILAFLPLAVRWRRVLLVATAALHFALVLASWQVPAALSAADGWLAIDDAALLFLTISSTLFLAAALYAIGYLSTDTKKPIRDYLEGFDFGTGPRGFLSDVCCSSWPPCRPWPWPSIWVYCGWRSKPPP